MLKKNGQFIPGSDEILPTTEVNIFYSDGVRALSFDLTLHCTEDKYINTIGYSSSDECTSRISSGRVLWGTRLIVSVDSD